MIRSIVIIQMTVVLLTAQYITAQQNVAVMQGKITQEGTSAKSGSCKMQVLREGVKFIPMTSLKSSEYKVEMPLGYVYDIEFSSDGFLSKVIRIDTRNIPEESRADAFELNVDGNLFKVREGFNAGILKQAMAKAEFDRSTGKIIFDEEYSHQRSKLVELEFARLEDLAKNGVIRKHQFDSLINHGKESTIKIEYQVAVSDFEKALAIDPNDLQAQSLHNEALLSLERFNAELAKNHAYNLLVTSGDSCFTIHHYGEALRLYIDASHLRNDHFIQDKIYEAQLAVDSNLQRIEYENFILAGDELFSLEKYDHCITLYSSALDLYPLEPYPAKQIELARRILDKEDPIPVISLKYPETPEPVVHAFSKEPARVVKFVNYPLGNKVITEYRVDSGKKHDIYRKVESKNSTYYFHNERSVTEFSWDQAIISLKE